MKPTRRAIRAAKQITVHFDKMRATDTPGAALWKAFNWLAAQARRAGRIDDTTRAVLGLIALLRNGDPIPAELLRAADGLEDEDRKATRLLAIVEAKRRAA